MSEPLSRLYDLALRTLDDQEQRADAVRGRLGPTLAAAALGVTLLSGPLVGGEPPHGAAGKIALVIAAGGFFVAALSALALLQARQRVSLDADPQALRRDLGRIGALEDVDAFHAAMITRFSRTAATNAELLDGLHTRFTAMLYGIQVMLCGLALAALVG